ELSMSMRMVPLRSTFQKMARVVRDTASKVGKSVQFTTEGDDVEIDRNLVDLLADPLVHMVRNAVDHGIESPDGRDRAGKSRTGSVRLHAYHASGNVVVELIDDGGGLHRDRIVAKAIEKGLIESDRGMSDNEVFNLIFAPGFSTAEKVTDISGRGVGLDVVRRNLEMIRGTLEISSTPGVGATFSIRLPLTLAVTDGMLVRVGAERFVIPMTQIHMSFRPEAPMLSTVVGQGEMVLLRGSLMPLVRLHRLFSVTDAIENPLTALLVIVGDGAQRTALMVDELLGQQQVVAKPLGDGLGRVPGFSGGAILGDGRVGLILDVRETMSLTTFPATSTLKLAS
ncbi:MAG: chemotaxis protein CheA, partial [Gemmatimonas sp.]